VILKTWRNIPKNACKNFPIFSILLLRKKPKINKINELRREENPNIFVEKTTTKFVGKPKTLGGGTVW